MRWKTGLGSSRRKNSSKEKGGGKSSSSSKRDVGTDVVQPVAAVSGDVSGPSAHNLGTVRVGILRPDSAPVCTPTPRAKRQLISELLEPDDGDEESNGNAVSASPALRSIISNKSSSGKNFDKEVGRGDSFTSYTPEEKVVFASHLNAHLLGDPFLRHLLPLDAGGADFFEKFCDGVLLCRIVCLAVPGSIADSNINMPSGSEPLSLYKSTENLNVALKAAEGAGLQVVNIGASDIIDGRPASILGLCWQLVRVHLLAQINLKLEQTKGSLFARRVVWCGDTPETPHDLVQYLVDGRISGERRFLDSSRDSSRLGHVDASRGPKSAEGYNRTPGLRPALIRAVPQMKATTKRCPDLVHLMEDGEEKETFFALPVEDVLLRWFNHHLRWGGNPRRVSNFSQDLVDGHCYISLMKELNDKFQECDFEGEDPKRAQFRRACLVISGAEGIGIAPLIRPRHITGKAHLYNIAFVAQLLNRRPRIHRERLQPGAATVLQSWYRMLRVMYETAPIIESRRTAVTKISRVWRARAAVKREENKSASALQAWWRGVCARRETRSFREAMAATKMQASWRGSRARREAVSKRESMASTKLQACWRGSSVRKEVLERKQRIATMERERSASTKLQACWRGSSVRKEVLEKKQRIATIERERSASTKLQACWRSSSVRKEVLERKQRIATMERERSASTKLQACWRSSSVRKGVLVERRRVVAIEKERLASTKLQACWRGSRVRKEVLERKQRMASIKLQACWRASQGRAQATAVRRERQVTEEKIAAIKRAQVIRRARLARAKAARAAELAQAKAETLKAEADAAFAKAQSEKGALENAAATKLQAWARGTEIRKAMAIVREANIRGRLDSYDSSGHCILKVVPKTSLSVSPRTSVASSVRSLEETDGGETPAKPSSSWFNKIFAGISFTPPPKRSTMASPGPSTKIERTEAAAVIQRWGKQVVEGRKEMMQAMARAERRRWAVRTLHRAYFNKWRFELARKTALRKQREEAEQEERERKISKAKWLGAIWGDIARGVAAAFEYKGRRDETQDESKETTDCCDAKGHAVLASEVAWKQNYVTGLVVGRPGIGDAQEERAKELSRRGIDVESWSPPENALSPAKCVIMMAALVGVALETTLSTAAVSGI